MKNKQNTKRILSVTIKRMVDESPDTSWLGKYASSPNSEFSIDRAHSEDCASQTYNPQTIEAKRILGHVQQTIGDLHSRVLASYNGTLANEKLDSEKDALDAAYDEVGDLLDDVSECDCGEHGDMERNQYRYFNPGSVESFDPKATWLESTTESERKAEWLKCMRSNAKQDYERMESLNRGDFCFIGIRAEAEIKTSTSTTAGAGLISSGGLWGIESDSDKSYLESVEAEELSALRQELKSRGFSSRAISTAFKNVERKDS